MVLAPLARAGLTAHAWGMSMFRIPGVLGLCCCTFFALGVAALLRGQESTEAKVQKLFDESRSRAEGIQVSEAVGARTTKATVHPTPLMKYVDLPRQIEMATLWIWKDGGYPVALGKVEAYTRKGGPKWLYCFASTSTGLVEGQWPDGRHFQSQKPGVEWTTIHGPVPQETTAGRLRQMKELFGRFSATARDDVLRTSDELRPLARPLHEYSSPKHGALQGVLCGFAANGANPDVIVALEAVVRPGGDEASKSWRYGVIGMTASGFSVKLDKVEVFTRRHVKSPGDCETWTYFWEGTPRK
jgi:hypothetical protein